MMPCATRSTSLPHGRGPDGRQSDAFYLRGLSTLFYNTLSHTTQSGNKNNNNRYKAATDVTIMNSDNNASHEDLLDLQRPLGARLLGNTGGAIGE